MKVAIIGIGNVLNGDDGIGPHVARLLAATYEFPEGVTCEDFGTPGYELTTFIMDRDAVVLVDAVKLSGAPGEVHVVDKDELLKRPMPGVVSAHEPGVREALLNAQFNEVLPKVFKLIGVIPEQTESNAPLSPVVARFFLGAGIPLYEGYGLTESSPVLAANRPEDWRLGTVGVPYPGVELQIGPEGEILARGPQVMQGYWNNPEATRAAIDADGWLHTGDVGAFDEDGFLAITDRIKELIVTAGGKKVAPQPIEGMTRLSPFVAQSVLVGDRRPFPALLVVPEFERLMHWAKERGLEITDRARLIREAPVIALLEAETLGRLAHLAQFERPKKLAILSEDLTVDGGLLTPTFKVKRRLVEKHFQATIEALYAEVAAKN